MEGEEEGAVGRSASEKGVRELPSFGTRYMEAWNYVGAFALL
jgi:hypothetical protein